MFRKNDHHFAEGKTPRRQAPKGTLWKAGHGENLRVVSLPGHHESALRLREMGIAEDCLLRKVMSGGAVLCEACGCRVALGRPLAEEIIVERAE